MGTAQVLLGTANGHLNKRIKHHNPHRSLHSKAFAGIVGPGGAGGSNFLNQTKKGKSLIVNKIL